MLNISASRIKFAALIALGLTIGAGLYSRLMGNSAAQQKSTMAETSSHYVIKPTEKHTGTVIFLHGLGDTGQGWSVMLQEASALPYLKFVCPNAAPIPVSLNSGFRMPSWFDIYSLTVGGREDSAGIKRAAALVHSYIDDEIASSGIPSERIVLGGFSQGGALALYSALMYPKKLNSVVALSCWMPLHKDLLTPDAIKGNNRHTPVFQGHGDSDYVVPKKFGDLTAAFLKEINPNATYKTYPGLQHSSNDEELRDLKKFLEKHLPRQ